VTSHNTRCIASRSDAGVTTACDWSGNSGHIPKTANPFPSRSPAPYLLARPPPLALGPASNENANGHPLGESKRREDALGRTSRPTYYSLQRETMRAFKARVFFIFLFFYSDHTPCSNTGGHEALQAGHQVSPRLPFPVETRPLTHIPSTRPLTGRPGPSIGHHPFTGHS